MAKKTRKKLYEEAYSDTPSYKKKKKMSALDKIKQTSKKITDEKLEKIGAKRLNPGDPGYKTHEDMEKLVKYFDTRRNIQIHKDASPLNPDWKPSPLKPGSKKKKADPSDKWDVRKAVKQAHTLNPPKTTEKKLRKISTKPTIKKVKSKSKMEPIKKQSRWEKIKSAFKAKKVEKPKAKKRNLMNIKKLQKDEVTGIKKSKKIPDWQGKKTKLTAKQKKAKADAYKGPMTGVEKAAAKKSKDDFKTGASKADLYKPVDQSKGVSKAKTVTRKDTTVKTEGGDYPKYRKDTTSSKSFSKTFAAARKAGKKTFEWQGRKYSTKIKADGGKVKKMQQGGMVDTPETQAFKQGVRYMNSGGRVSVSNDNAGAGDIAHVHSHSGYKAGE